MMCGPPTQSLSKYDDLSNIFAVHSCLQPIKLEKQYFHMTCRENVLSNHEEPVRSTGFLMRETPHLFYKIYRKKRPNSMLTTEASFYLSINYSKDSGRCWFKTGAVGVNKAGLEERPWLTNHSTRKTPLQQQVHTTDMFE